MSKEDFDKPCPTGQVRSQLHCRRSGRGVPGSRAGTERSPEGR